MVRHLLAVQSQDYPGAKWGVGQRVASTTEVELDRLFDAGAIIRTHVMRPTWHFVDPADLRWQLELTAPRVHQASAYQYRNLEIDGALAARAAAIFVRELEGGRARTRAELGRALADAGIESAGLRGGYLLAHAELEAIVCSGPRRGKSQTYALFDERVPASRPRSRDEALAEIARRYVQGHGPAQAIDLAWWSGLTVRDARRALEAAGPALLQETIGGRRFWVAADGRAAADPEPADAPDVRLLPNYDELLVAFRDRSDATDPGLPAPARVAAAILAHIVVRDGLVVGGWKRAGTGGPVMRIDIDLLVGLTEEEQAGLAGAVAHLARFLGRPVEVTGLD